MGQIMARYDFLEARWMILSNVWTDSNLTWFHFWSTLHMNLGKWWPDMTSSRPDEWFWPMFELTFGIFFMARKPLVIWIGGNYDQIWLPEARQLILSDVWTDCNMPNLTFGQLFLWNAANNDQIWLPVGYTTDSEWCLSDCNMT